MWNYRKFNLTGAELEDNIANALNSTSSGSEDSEASCGSMSIRNSVSGNLQVWTFRPSLICSFSECIKQKYLCPVINSNFCFQAILAVYGSARLFFFAESRVNIPYSLQAKDPWLWSFSYLVLLLQVMPCFWLSLTLFLFLYAMLQSRLRLRYLNLDASSSFTFTSRCDDFHWRTNEVWMLVGTVASVVNTIPCLFLLSDLDFSDSFCSMRAETLQTSCTWTWSHWCAYCSLYFSLLWPILVLLLERLAHFTTCNWKWMQLRYVYCNFAIFFLIFHQSKYFIDPDS